MYGYGERRVWVALIALTLFPSVMTSVLLIQDCLERESSSILEDGGSSGQFGCPAPHPDRGAGLQTRIFAS